MMNRRRFMAAAPVALSAWPAFARTADLRGLERSCGGRIGLYARDLKTGAQIAWRADERFAMCSTFKASLAAAVLARVDAGRERLDRVIPYGKADLLGNAPATTAHVVEGGMRVGELCEAAVELSDNTAANLLLAQIGGPQAVTAFLRGEGDRITRLDRTEPSLNVFVPGDPRDTTTPRAMAGTLDRLLLGQVLSAASRERLKGWMLGCKTGDKRLRAGLPRSWSVADKTGTSGRGDCGDIAVTWRAPAEAVLICAYMSGATVAVDAQEAALAEIGRMVGRRFS